MEGWWNKMNDALSLRTYYPHEYVKITDVINKSDKIEIHLKSVTRECDCPGCDTKLTKYHGTYLRKVQDLPILGKNVELLINIREYQCTNENCKVTTVTETFNGFLNAYSRMTERCADFICTLAMETSCEGSARICRAMNLSISGDTIIRLLTKRFQLQEQQTCGAVIGIDDFAFRKRYKYGTIIVDEATRNPVAILDGRDGETLKTWLQNNRHVKAVTRDRASAYATAIQEILPEAMQIADRFHLHQNLLEVIRSSLNSFIPVTIKIPKDMAEINEQKQETGSSSGDGKKNGYKC